MRRHVLSAAALGLLLHLTACTTSSTSSSPACERDDQCGLVQLCQANNCVDGPIVAGLPPVSAATGSGVVVKTVDSPTELLTGNAAQGRVGDLLMKNSRAAFIIQAPGREIGPVLYGGNLVDAVALRGDGTPYPDEFGEVAPLLNLGMTVDFTRHEVVRDGRSGGAGVVRFTGPVRLWDFVNLQSFLTDGFSTLVPFDLEEELPLQVVVTYELRPDEPVLHVTWTLLNQGTSGRQLPVGVIVDSGGAVEPFRSNGGFGKPSYSAASILEAAKSVPWFGYMGQHSCSALRPLPVTGEPTAESLNPTVQVAGVTVSLFSRPDVLAALAESDFYLRANEARSFALDVAVAGPSLADASGALRVTAGQQGRAFDVHVQNADGQPVEGAVVVVRGYDDVRAEILPPTDAARTNANGDAHFDAAAGTRRIHVRANGYPASAVASLAETDTAVTVTLERAGSLTYHVNRRDNPQSADETNGACRVTVLGRAQFEDAVLKAIDTDDPGNGVAAVRYSANCNSDEDGALPLQPGRYLVEITGGPEVDAVEQLVDVGITGTVDVGGTLHRVVDGTGYVASDWHQHTVNSPDSPIPLRDRLISYLAEGIAIFGGSDHDVITNWEQLVADFGFADRIQAINGVESTPFEYGHFNVFPLIPDATKVNGGAVDWAGGEGYSLTPPQIWDAYRERGAQVIQVNHPRGLGGTFQTYFDRAALTFSFNMQNHTGEAVGDVAAQPATNESMRLAPLEPMWGTRFDSVEIYNGTTVYPGPPATRRPGDRKADRIFLDVANLTLVGHRPVMVGTSDTHSLKKGENGYPRTYVRAQKQPNGRVDPQEVLGALAALGMATNRGDVVVSNGPVPVVTVRAGAAVASPGGLLPAADGMLTVHVELQAPTWMRLSHVEVLVSPNALNGVNEDNPSLPVAQTLMLPAPNMETLPNGGERQTWSVDVPVNLTTENPFDGRDATVLVRVLGREVLFPVMLERLNVTVEESGATAAEFATVVNGVTAFAVTNPVYVDVDGDGRFKGAFEP